MKKVKRLIFICTICLLMCTCMTTSVDAGTKTVATIGSKKYSSLQSAVDQVKNGQTIKLKTNIKLKKDIVVKRKGISFTLDLNKKTLKEGYYSIEVNKGKVTVKNGKVNGSTELFKIGKSGKVDIKNGTYNGFLSNEGTLNIKNGIFVNKDDEYPQIINSGKLTITKGTFQSYGNVVKNTGTAVIKKGTFKNTNKGYGIPVIYNAAVNYSNGKGKITKSILGEMTIQKGNFTAEQMVIGNSGKLIINGGNYNGSRVQNGLYYADEKKATITVNGGNFQAEIYDAGKKVTITGGIFENTSSYYADARVSGNLLIKGGIFKGSVMLPKKYSITFPKSEYANHFFAEVRDSYTYDLIYEPEK